MFETQDIVCASKGEIVEFEARKVMESVWDDQPKNGYFYVGDIYKEQSVLPQLTPRSKRQKEAWGLQGAMAERAPKQSQARHPPSPSRAPVSAPRPKQKNRPWLPRAISGVRQKP